MSTLLISDSIPGHACAMNAAGEIELLNRQVLEFFGKPAEELKNWATGDAIHPDDRERVIANFAQSIATGNPYSVEHICRRSDGVYRWFDVRALPVRGTNGLITGWHLLLPEQQRVDDDTVAIGQLISTVGRRVFAARRLK